MMWSEQSYSHRGAWCRSRSDGAGFDPMIQRAERLRVAGVDVPIVRRDDLIAMKERAAADPARRRSLALRDRADVELLRGDVPDPDEGW